MGSFLFMLNETSSHGGEVVDPQWGQAAEFVAVRVPGILFQKKADMAVL